MTDEKSVSPARTGVDDFAAPQAVTLRVKKMTATATLCRVVVHELNNILASVLGYAELSLLDVPEDSEVHQHLEATVSVCGRAKPLVEQLRVFSLRAFQDLRPLQIQDIAKEVVAEATATLPESIRVTHSVKDDCRKVMADEEQIKQVFQHLLDNARRAMEKTGGTLTITVDECELAADQIGDPGAAPGPFVHFAVGDTGPGIDADLADRMFDPFVTTRDEEKRVGVGLSNVQCFVKQHGGVTRVSSTPGKGSVFHVYVPVQPSVDTGSRDL